MRATSDIRTMPSFAAGPRRRGSAAGACTLLTGLLLGLGAGCRPGPDAGGAAEPLIVAVDAVHVLGTAESLARVIDMDADTGGTVWVLNQGEPFIVAFGADGRVRSTAGRRGQGPHEFLSPQAIVAGPAEGDVWVFEGTRHALVRVTGPEDQWRELALRSDSARPMLPVTFDNLGMGMGRPWLVKLEDGFILARSQPGSGGPFRIWNGEVMWLDANRLTLTLLFSPADLLGDPVSRYGPATVMLPYPLWAMCPDRSFVLYDPLQNLLRRLVTGKETQSQPLPPERRLEITLDRILPIVFRQMSEDMPAAQRPDSATMRAQLHAELSASEAELSSVFPEYTDLQCTADGIVWLQPFDAVNGYMGKGQSWLRLTPDGAMREVRLPESFRPFRFQGSRIWGVSRDDLDVQSIAWVDLMKLTAPAGRVP